MIGENIWRVGVSSCGAQDLTLRDFENYADAGIMTMELSFSWDRYAGLDWQGIRKRAERTGIELWSFHLPFCPFETTNIASSDAAVRNHTVEMSAELLKKAADIGVKVIVIHSSAEPIADGDRTEAMNHAKESLARLAAEAGKAGVTIAVEDLPRTCLGRNSDEISELLQADERLRVCFDTNHLLKQPVKDFILAEGGKIITTHLSDYDFKDERHWLPGEGKIDWAELVDTLEKVRYQGPFIYELNLNEPSTLRRGRDLTYADFRKNHLSLIGRKKPDAVGKPVPELCLPWEWGKV